MKKIISLALIMLLCPAFSFAEYRDSRQHYRSEPSRYYRQQPEHSERHHGHSSHGHSHNDSDWIVPLAIVGTALGVMALSQQYSAPPPPPQPQRMCRDAYNHVDQYGRYLYTEYVDRPCND
jgi:hypothetical protein